MANVNTTKTLPALTVEQANTIEGAIYEMEALPIDCEEPGIHEAMLRALVREGKRQVSEALKPLHEAKIAQTSRAVED